MWISLSAFYYEILSAQKLGFYYSGGAAIAFGFSPIKWFRYNREGQELGGKTTERLLRLVLLQEAPVSAESLLRV